MQNPKISQCNLHYENWERTFCLKGKKKEKNANRKYTCVDSNKAAYYWKSFTKQADGVQQ